MTYPDGETVTTGYDARGLPKSLTGSSTYVGDTSYNALGQVELRKLGAAASPTLVTDYVYRTDNYRLQQIKTGPTSPYTGTQNLGYAYDAVGNVIGITDTKANETWTYGYDALDRLDWTKLGGAPQQDYSYDAIGNITYYNGLGSAPYYKYSGGKPHAVTHLSTTTGGAGTQKYWYDANGNMTTRVENGVTYQQTFDAENSMVRVTANGQTTTFTYDGDGARVKKVDPDGTVTHYVGNYYEAAFTSTVGGAAASAAPGDQEGQNPPEPSPDDDPCLADPTAPGCAHWVVRTPTPGKEAKKAVGLRPEDDPCVGNPAAPGCAHWVVTRPAPDQNVPRGQGTEPLAGSEAAGPGASSQPGAASASELPDPGFETTAGWSENGSSAFPGTSFFRSTWGTAAPHGGSYAYALSNQAYGYLRSDPIPVTAGVQYDLYAYVRGELDPDDSHGGWIIRACFYNSSGAYLSYQDMASGGAGSLDPTWQQKGGRLTTPANAATVRIDLYNYMNSGWVAYDDASLVKVGTSTNLVPNPGFETGAGWSEVRAAQYPGTSFFRATWGTAAPHGGSYAYAISNHVYGYLRSDPIAISPNTQYDLYAYVRGELDPDDSHGGWIIRACFYNSSGAYLSYQDVASGGAGSLTTTWQNQGGQVTAPANAATVRIDLYNYMNSGWVAYDDVSLVRGTGTELIPNPGFEGSTGWSEVRASQYPGTSFFRSSWGTAEPHSGSRAYALSNHVYGLLRSDPLPVTAGLQYDLYAWVRGELDAEDSHCNWIIRACFYDSSGAYLSYQNAAYGGAGSLTTTWQNRGGRVTAPAGAATMRIDLYNYMNSGWAAYDDVTLPVQVSATKYYYLGGQRVALRQGGTLYYLLTDHLGSTALTANSSGTKTGELRYKAYGETRYASGTTPTSRRFTGQLEESTIGLYDYGARFYDPALGRFLSADPLVPRPGDPQNLNRYTYVRNNPLKYIDPSGYYDNEDWKDTDPNAKRQIIFGIKKTYGTSVERSEWWTVQRLTLIRQTMDEFPMGKVTKLDTIRYGGSDPRGGAAAYNGDTRTLSFYDTPYDEYHAFAMSAGVSDDLLFKILTAHELTHAVQRSEVDDRTWEKIANNPKLDPVQVMIAQSNASRSVQDYAGGPGKLSDSAYPSAWRATIGNQPWPAEKMAVAASLTIYAPQGLAVEARIWCQTRGYVGADRLAERTIRIVTGQ